MDPIKTFLRLRMVARSMERKLKGLVKYLVLVFFVAAAAVVGVAVVDFFVDHCNILPFRCYLFEEAFGFLQFPIFYSQRNVAVKYQNQAQKNMSRMNKMTEKLLKNYRCFK